MEASGARRSWDRKCMVSSRLRWASCITVTSASPITRPERAVASPTSSDTDTSRWRFLLGDSSNWREPAEPPRSGNPSRIGT